MCEILYFYRCEDGGDICVENKEVNLNVFFLKVNYFFLYRGFYWFGVY